MVDRGLMYSTSKCVTLNIPPFFLQGKELLPLEEVETRSIASIRIHVERATEQVKKHCILQCVIPISLHAQMEMKFGLFVAFLQIFILY